MIANCTPNSVRYQRPATSRWKRKAQGGIIPSMSTLLLVVEDDPSLREVIRLGLEGEGFEVAVAENGPSALLAFASQKPDLVLLDVMLPELDGFAVCREIRKISLVPIIMLTARTSTLDIVAGLESGADDYLTKPFEFPELIARVRSALRRATALAVREEAHRDEPVIDGAVAPAPSDQAGGQPVLAPGAAPLGLGPLTIDPAAYLVRRGAAELALTATEFRLLYEFARHPGQVLTRDQLLELVWGYTYLGDSRLVDVHVQRLRAKIEDDPTHPLLILTVRGVGYRAGRTELG